MAENNNIFTNEEVEMLATTKKVRMDVVKNMTKGGVPESTGSLRVLNEYLNSIDDVVQKSAANRLKHQDTQNKEAMLDMVSEVLKSTARRRAEVKVDAGMREIPVELEVIDVVPGETEIDPGQLDMVAFLGKQDDN